eukprot:Skav205723  [mRNA]  locus=scaffold1496:86191:86769:+ [translate_table: standard]
MPSLLVGLGNPWPSKSRHNLGSLVLEALAEELGLDWEWRWSCWSWIAAKDGNEGSGSELALMIPGTFYNLSGWAVQRGLRTLNLGPGDVVVLHDDIDLESFDWALVHSESDAGNRGVRSVLHAAGVVSRLRLGVGRPANRNPASVAAHVLGPLEADLLQRWQSAAASGEVLQILRTHSEDPTGRKKQKGRLS